MLRLWEWAEGTETKFKASMVYVARPRLYNQETKGLVCNC